MAGPQEECTSQPAIDSHSSSTCPFIALTAGPAAGGSYRARKPSQMQTLEQHRSGSHKLL